MNSIQLSDAALSNLLCRIALAPNLQVINTVIGKFQSSFPEGFPFGEIIITEELTRRFLLASARLRRSEDIPEPLQALMQRVQICLRQGLQINPVLATHLQKIVGDATFDSSCVDNLLSAVRMTGRHITFPDLFALLGTEWGVNTKDLIEGIFLEPLHTLDTFYDLIIHASRLNAGTQSALWKKCGLSSEAFHLIDALKRRRIGTLIPPTAALLEDLKTSGKTQYIPIGYADTQVFFISLLAIDYSPPGYRLRLLTSDGRSILPAGDKLNHYCPEVIWEGLEAEQLTAPRLWKTLFEAATLDEIERLRPGGYSEAFLSFDSTHLVPYLTGVLGKCPCLAPIQTEQTTWDRVLVNKYHEISDVISRVKSSDNPDNKNQKDLLLMQTGKEIKHTIFIQSLHKFVNLLPLDLLPTRNEMLLFKAESRLLLLVASFLTLKERTSSPVNRGNFLRLIEQSYGKVTGPIETLMQLDPSEEQRASARILLVSLLDLKHRLADFLRTADHIPPIASQPLYPSTHIAHRIDLSGISWRPIEHTLLDSMRLNEGAAPLPFHNQWTFERLPALYESLEQWYELLLDAKCKCEPIELLNMAHRNVFSKLPIPSTGRVEDTFPDDLSEGLQVGTLLLLKKISSLIAAEAYTVPMIPPIFVADMARVYRFSLELYRQINPDVRHLPVSWFCLHQYLVSRHSFHAPGEVKETLEAVAASFKLISPKGHLRPSEEFQEIPLFYFFWRELPKKYKYHRESLGPFVWNLKSVDEVLTIAELADSIGLRLEEIENRSSKKNNPDRWVNSFGGQCVLTLEQIAQYFTMSTFATADAYRKALANKLYSECLSCDILGPEDHFQLIPVQSSIFIENRNHFGGHGEFDKQVELGETPMPLRMVSLKDKKIQAPVSDISIQGVEEWRDQADLIKALSKRDGTKGTYQLHQAASGPSSLSLDVLLEYFEARPALLLSLDYRSYFWAVVRSAHVTETACSKEPLLFDRMKAFAQVIHNEDRLNFNESALNFERLLWLSDLTRYLCKISPYGQETFSPLLQQIMQDLYVFGRGQSPEVRLAPHLLVAQMLLPIDSRLPLPELARLHLLIGRNPPNDPNEVVIWMEATQAMQSLAPIIQIAMMHGNESIRRDLWRLILSSDADIAEVMNRQPMSMRLATLVKTSAQMERLRLKQNYFERWVTYWKKNAWRKQAWREDATAKALPKIQERLALVRSEVNGYTESLLKTAEELLCFTPTSLLVQISGRTISVDWETGRILGGGNDLPLATALPIYLRKHPDLAPLGQLLHRPLVNLAQGGRVHFQENQSVTIDTSIGAAWLSYGDHEYRLVSQQQLHSMELPDQLRERFSVWLSENPEGTLRGLVAAHTKDGNPVPAFVIDHSGVIRPLSENSNLRLAGAGYYPEAQLFSRWGLTQNNILVWLDDEANVAELHLPLHNTEGRFTRIIRRDDGSWWVDGLEVRLEATEESIPAFAGHPVYLVAKNREGQRILLLSGATPYEIQIRRQEQCHRVDWNQLLTSGSKEGIHQYRIMPSGQIEGLTVSDNLLLMLWTLYMGHYPATTELAKRWLTPPGRPYTKEEQRILLSWVDHDCDKNLMKGENHPSALSIRLFVMVRMTRHLRDFPSEHAEGKKMPELWRVLVSPNNIKTYVTKQNMSEKLMHLGMLGSQIRGTNFEELISVYDHEAALRFVYQDYRESATPVQRRLTQRLTENRVEHVQGLTRITYNIDGREILGFEDYSKWGDYVYQSLIAIYPITTQNDQLPVDRIYRNIIQVSLIEFFDRAYTVIKEGEEQEAEHIALIYAFDTMRSEKAIDTCLRYFDPLLSYSFENINEPNILLWLILEQAFLAKKAGHALPELPSISRRFGLALQGSKEASHDFFSKIVVFSGTSASRLLHLYRQEWLAKRGMHYLEQEQVRVEQPPSFKQSMMAPQSNLLTSKIDQWRHLSSPMQPVPQSELDWIEWSYPTPAEWAKTPFTETGLLSLQQRLLDRLSVVSHTKNEREIRLLSLANALPEDKNRMLLEFARQIHYVAPRSVDECIGLALIGKSRNWQANCPMTAPIELQQATLLYLEVALEEAHLQRIKRELRICMENPQDTDRMQQLQESLKTEHHYLPSSATIPLMAAEYYSDCRLRTQPDQAALIQILTRESNVNKGSVIQAIMGSGKSKMLAPIWLQMMLGTGRIPLYCVPSSLFRTTLSDLQNMMWSRFRTHVRAFTFDRESCTSDTLHHLAEALHIAGQEPTVFVCAPRDLHALQLMLKERHQVIEEMRERLQDYTITWARSSLPHGEYKQLKALLSKGKWETTWSHIPSDVSEGFNRWFNSHIKLEEELRPIFAESNLLQGILNLLQNQAALLVDEVATSYDPRNLLSFPIGWQTQANPQAATMACKIYFEWLPDYFNELNLVNNMQSFTPETQRQDIYLGIAEKAWQEYGAYLSHISLPPLKNFTAYLFSDPINGKEMHVLIKNLNKGKSILMRQYAQELAFLKYCLTTGLDGALTSTGHVNYGRSKQNTELYLTIPFECANVPKENTLFRRPWKTVLMTCQHYIQGWLDPRQTAEFISFLHGIDPSSKDQEILEAAAHIWGRSFGDVDISDDQTMKKLTSDLDSARMDPEKAQDARLLIKTYLQCCVFPSQLKLDPSQLISTPQDLPMIAAKGDAMGGTFSFENTWNPKLKRVHDFSCDESILKALAEPRNQHCHILPNGGAEALLAGFESGALSGYMALIDTGALFKGLSNTTVARRLLQAVNGFDCIIFYDEEQPGGARLAVMGAMGKTLLEHSDKEGVRRALTQLKLSAPFTYYDQARRIGADLELPVGRALVTFSDVVIKDDLLQSTMRCRYLLDGRHSVAYAIPGEMTNNRHEGMDDDWNGNKVITMSKVNQKCVEEKANFQGICEQLRGVVRAAIDHTMRSTADPEMRHQIHKAASAFLLEMQDNDLVDAFGSLQGKVRSHEALKSLAKQLYKQIDRVLPAKKRGVLKDLQYILHWHRKSHTPLPKWVRLGDEHEEAVQEVDISKDQDRMRLMEEEYERMLGTRNPKKEIAWSNFNPRLTHSSPIGCISKYDGMPAFYCLREALKERGFNVPFASHLLISANLLTTFLGESNCLLTENQKPVHRGLLIRGPKKSTLILVSEGDARHLKEHLSELPEERGKGIYLLEPSGAINQRGWRGEQIVNLWEEGTLEEHSLLLQALLFQGSALLLDKLPHAEVTAAMKHLTQQKPKRICAIRILFEAALDQRPDDMLHYRRSQSLRALLL